MNFGIPELTDPDFYYLFQTRESYVKYFKDLLKKNWLSAHKRAFEFTDKDFEDAAINMEYNIFSDSRVNAIYKKKIAKEVSLT